MRAPAPKFSKISVRNLTRSYMKMTYPRVEVREKLGDQASNHRVSALVGASCGRVDRCCGMLRETWPAYGPSSALVHRRLLLPSRIISTVQCRYESLGMAMVSKFYYGLGRIVFQCVHVAYNGREIIHASLPLPCHRSSWSLLPAMRSL